jgi:hypothetical protein
VDGGKMKIILYDATENGIKEWFWRRYVQVRIGWKKIGVSSWGEAAEQILEAVRPGDRLTELQVWGDGGPGMPYINGKPITEQFIETCRILVTSESLVWFRMCAVLFGRKGDTFVRELAKKLGCRIAAHTHVIGVWHSGLWTVAPDSLPTFDPHAGDWTKLESGPFQPRTIFCARLSVPKGW